MKTIAFGLCWVFTVMTPAVQAQPAEEMAQKIVELRETVELLNSEYETKKETVFNDLKSLASQKAEMEARIREEELREKQINLKIAELKKSISEVTALGSSLSPLVLETLDDQTSYIENSLPFKQSERHEALELLKGKIKTSETSPVKAALQLWSLQEDERRLASDISLSKQTLEVDGKSYLADVAKVGMMFLYFQLDDGRAGQAVRGQNGWNYQVFQSTDDTQRIYELMGSIKKQIRTGAFELPIQKQVTGETI